MGRSFEKLTKNNFPQIRHCGKNPKFGVLVFSPLCRKKKHEDLYIPKNSVIIDCLFGIGISRDLKGFYKKIIKKVNSSKQHIISIDIPSGINGNNGKIMGEAIKADSTYTLHAKKIGLTVNPGMKYCGKISIIDIGIR